MAEKDEEKEEQTKEEVPKWGQQLLEGLEKLLPKQQEQQQEEVEIPVPSPPKTVEEEQEEEQEKQPSTLNKIMNWLL